MAVALDSVNTRSSPWSDQRILDKAWQWVDSKIPATEQRYWLVEDTGMPKKGKHSVGVSHQYCGQLGKTCNCQVAVSVSLASKAASIPVAWQLYLPKTWIEDHDRCAAVGVPQEMTFNSKTEIALKQLTQCFDREIPKGIVQADSGYGHDHAFREGLDKLSLAYVVGVRSNTSVWAPGVVPVISISTRAKGRQPIRIKYSEGHRPESVRVISDDLDDSVWEFTEWREGTNDTLGSWLTALRIHAAHRDNTRGSLRPEQWLLIEWLEDEPKPTKYWLGNLPESTTLKQLVYTAKMRWHIERDYQELKDELGLNHYEGRNWRGFHHHATLCTAAYAYLVTQRIEASKGLKKNTAKRKKLTVPNDYIVRGSPEIATAC